MTHYGNQKKHGVSILILISFLIHSRKKLMLSLRQGKSKEIKNTWTRMLFVKLLLRIQLCFT